MTYTSALQAPDDIRAAVPRVAVCECWCGLTMRMQERILPSTFLPSAWDSSMSWMRQLALLAPRELCPFRLHQRHSCRGMRRGHVVGRFFRLSSGSLQRTSRVGAKCERDRWSHRPEVRNKLLLLDAPPSPYSNALLKKTEREQNMEDSVHCWERGLKQDRVVHVTNTQQHTTNMCK